MSLSFRVHGTPAPQGSKRHLGNGVMVESSAKVKPWRQDVKYAALAAASEDDEWQAALGPVIVGARFLLARPKSHYRTGKNAHLLRDNAPEFPAKKPDLDKLLRSTLDALGEAGIWGDDSQVVEISASKRYADGIAPGAQITVIPLGEQ